MLINNVLYKHLTFLQSLTLAYFVAGSRPKSWSCRLSTGKKELVLCAVEKVCKFLYHRYL